MPDNVHHEQQLMLEALQRHKQQELHLLMQRKTVQNSTNVEVLRKQQDKWPDGYIAICAVVKDQGKDLRWLGVSKFYIYDNNSTLPAMMVLWDYLRDGIVEYQYFLGKPRKKPEFTDTNQYKAYHSCLLQHFRQHRWLAFIDVDEFFVFAPSEAPGQSAAASSNGSSPAVDGTAHRRQLQAQQQVPQQFNTRKALRDPAVYHAAAGTGTTGQTDSGDAERTDGTSKGEADEMDSHSLPLFLSGFEQRAAVGVNWVLFGSSGLLKRPQEGPLASFTSCVPQQHWESTHVKVIANTAGILGIGPTPHEMLMRPGMTTVDVDGQPFKGPKTPKAKWHKLVLHHYVLKSKAEFATKSARGSGAGNVKTWGYWDYIEGLCTSNCSAGLAVSQAFLASHPQLKQISSPGHFCSHSVQHSAAERLKAAAAGVLAREEHGAPSQWNGKGVKAGQAGGGGAAAPVPARQDVTDILDGGDTDLYDSDQ
eukprot:gene11536-11679_t